MEIYFDEDNGAWVICPHCGQDAQLPLDDIQRQVVDAVHKLARHSGAASTQSIALEVALSYSQAGRHLRKLANMGLIRRVGERGGWRRAA